MTLSSAASLIDLEPNEHVTLEVRRHMIVFYTKILFLVALFFIPLFLSPFIVILLDKALGGAAGAMVFGFLYTLWLLALWVMFFLQWTNYYLDVWVITNKRLFDIEQKGIFTRETSVFRLEHMQDITVEIRGIIATFLKYGDVHIHTAGESHDITIYDAADPVMVKNTIMRTHSALLEDGIVSHVSVPTQNRKDAA
jgi:uncharacterized membrane protein YdbT with pleckstrin-like domain